MRLGALDAGSVPATTPLVFYLERLAQWSRRVRTVAGAARPWLPSVVRHSLAAQWWGATPPEPERLRAEIAEFWHQVIPWLAWHPETPAPPAPPPDRDMIEFVASRLDQEAARWPAPALGWSRGEAYRLAASGFRALLEAHRNGAPSPQIRLGWPTGTEPTLFLP